jgi:hypothetical protein
MTIRTEILYAQALLLGGFVCGLLFVKLVGH